jgi:hypothetical protein
MSARGFTGVGLAEAVTAYQRRHGKTGTVTEATIRRWLSGDSSPRAISIVALADIFEVSCDALMVREGQPRWVS